MGRSVCGSTHGAVRWNTCSRSTRGWMAGTYCIADAPVPMDATRLPARSWPWSHRAEWKVVPSKFSRPGTAGTFGVCSGPIPATSTCADTEPRLVSTRHRCAASSQAAPVTSVPHHTCG